MNQSSMEWLWRPLFDHVGKRGQILAHNMINDNYYAPDHFGFEDDGMFVSDENLTSFNADRLTS